MITSMRSSIIEALPMSDAQFGLLTSAFLWTYGILSPIAGFLTMNVRSRGTYTSANEDDVRQLRDWMKINTPQLLQL